MKQSRPPSFLKLRTGVATLSRSRRKYSIEMKRSVFHAIVGSRVVCMLSFHGVGAKNMLSRVDVPKNRAVKTWFGLAPRPGSGYIYKTFKILPVEDQRKIQIAGFVYAFLPTLSRPPRDRVTRRSVAGALFPTRKQLSSTDGFPKSVFTSAFIQMPNDLRNHLEYSPVASRFFSEHRVFNRVGFTREKYLYNYIRSNRLELSRWTGFHEVREERFGFLRSLAR